MKKFLVLICSSSQRARAIAWLVLRIGIGLIFMRHGYGKLIGGTQVWEFLGSNMALLGITFWPTFWGCAAACTEFFGGLMLVLGLKIRIAASLMAFVMFVATLMHWTNNDPWTALSHPLSMLVVFVSLAIAGSYHYSLDEVVIEKLAK